MLHTGAISIRLMIEGSGKTWKQDQRIRLQHVDTGAYLHSHDKKYQRIAGGQQEVRNRFCIYICPQLATKQTKFSTHFLINVSIITDDD